MRGVFFFVCMSLGTVALGQKNKKMTVIMVMDESSGTPHMDNHQDSPPWPQEGVTPSPQNNQILDGVQHD